MGIEDRDYYREGRGFQAEHKVTTSRSIESWLYIALLWILLMLALVKGARHFFPDEVNRFIRRDQLAPNVSEQKRPQAPPNIATAGELPKAALNGDTSRYSPQPSYAPQSGRSDESSGPGSTTIFRCKAYAGGTFWSSNHCQMHKALIDRTASVPAGLPFSEQVQLAEVQRAEAAALYNQAPPASVQFATRCAALKVERESIDARYSNWQWQPLEVINPDQRRMQALRAEQARLGCLDR